MWLALGIGLLLTASSLSPPVLLKRLLPFVLIGAGFLWANLLFHRSGNIGAGLRNGLMLFSRALVFGTYSLAFVQDMDPEAFAHALMRYLRAPAKLVYATLIAFRLGPEIREEQEVIKLALRLRGVPNGLRRAGMVLFGTFIGAFRRAGRISIALEGRGLDAGSRSYRRVPPFRLRDALFVFAALAALILPMVFCGTSRWGGGYF
jgi:energy-coupling factor transporter transmembrane protein EcfT